LQPYGDELVCQNNDHVWCIYESPLRLPVTVQEALYYHNVL